MRSNRTFALPSRAEHRSRRLRQWAMRAADMINGVVPARAAHLGNTCDYWAEFAGHVCNCNHIPATWELTYSDILARLPGDEQ